MDEHIRKNKPNISASTLKTYMSLLRSLYYKKHERGSEIKLNWFSNQDEVIKLLEDKAPASRKTTYAALIAVTDSNDKYKSAMMDDSKVYEKFMKTQEKTDKQAASWKDYDEVKKIYDDMHNKVKPLLKAEELSPADYKKLQDFVILSLTSGVWIPPRRSLDWVDLKIKNIFKKNDNYIDKNSFVFNKYKTAKVYGEQRVEIPKGLKTILMKFIRFNPHEYLLTDDQGKKMTNVRLTQKLNRIFGNNISTSMLRHIYLSNQLKDIPRLEELERIAKDMGHSVMEGLEYVKH